MWGRRLPGECFGTPIREKLILMLSIVPIIATVIRDRLSDLVLVSIILTWVIKTVERSTLFTVFMGLIFSSEGIAHVRLIPTIAIFSLLL